MAIEIGIVETGDFCVRAQRSLRSIGTVSLFDANKQSLLDFISDKHVLFIRLKYHWSEKLLSCASNLRYLCTPTTGLTHVDTAYAERAGITVLSLQGETEFLKTVSATTEHTFGLALSLLRKYNHAFLRPDDREWNRDKYKGYEIKGIRAGIIGMGRIGTMLSGYLNAFGAKLFYYDIRDWQENSDFVLENPYGAVMTDSVNSLVDASNIIFLCAAFSEENRNMINADVLGRMGGKFFVNTSRGEMVDEEALIPLIKKDFFAGIALDVLCGEPDPPHAAELAALSREHNVIVTPHIGGATYSSMWVTEDFIAKRLVKTLRAEKNK